MIMIMVIILMLGLTIIIIMITLKLSNGELFNVVYVISGATSFLEDLQ